MKKYKLKQSISNGLVEIGLVLATAGVFGLFGFQTYKRIDNAPETFKGFEKYTQKGYVVQKFDIPTQGDITEVKMLPKEQYRVSKKDGKLVLEGNFEYSIEPDIQFAPHADHSDNYGNTPDNCDYWADTREGTVILAPKTLEAKLK